MSQLPSVARDRHALPEAGVLPFLKWAGGKKRILPHLLTRLPETFAGYFEPFIGGGALFFRMLPGAALVSDINAELVNVYRTVRDEVDSLMEDLGRHRYEKNYYYAMRARDPEEMSPLSRASRFIYLNRTCFNGLYRVNRRGQFNVPFGRYTNPTICPTDKLLSASHALQGVDVRCQDYSKTVAPARSGDFVYFDPPYQPISRTANFTSYTKGAFDEAEQTRLADRFRDLDRRGVRCMLSNSDTPFVHDLYKGFRIELIDAPRAISRNPEGRASVREVIVRNY